MAEEISNLPEYRHTIEELEACRRTNAYGVDFWFAREVMPILSYDDWRNFESVIAKAKAALTSLSLNPLHHIVDTNRMMERGKGASVETSDYFISRQAARLIAMNGDPSKAEIAGAQAYFLVQTHRAEQADKEKREKKRVELRDNVTVAVKKVGDVAYDAGLLGPKFGLFHNARYEGMYGMSYNQLKAHRGLDKKDNPLDYAGPLELSANEFQMNTAASAIKNENIRGSRDLIAKNKAIAKDVRKTIADSGATMLEKLPVEESIKSVRKRLEVSRKNIS